MPPQFFKEKGLSKPFAEDRKRRTPLLKRG
jgi:hypothetical protein